MSDCGCCLCVETPQHILDETEIDVFAEVFPSTDSYYSLKRAALWARFRYRGLGYPCSSDDLSYNDGEITDEDGAFIFWLNCVKDRYTQNQEKYDVRFAAWSSWLQAQGSTPDLTTSGYREVNSGDDETVLDYDAENTNEDLPDTQDAAASSWLSDRQKNTTDSTTTVTHGHIIERTAEDGLGMQRIAGYLEAVPDPASDFAAEFDDLFFWGF